jgi:hypothetical protein
MLADACRPASNKLSCAAKPFSIKERSSESHRAASHGRLSDLIANHVNAHPMARAAEALLRDYSTDPGLTAFTPLDGVFPIQCNSAAR